MTWLFELHRTQPVAHAIGALAFVCVLGMALGGVVRIFPLAMYSVLAQSRSKPSTVAIDDGNANAQSAEVDAGNEAQTSFAFSMV